MWWPQKNIHKVFIPKKIFIFLKTQKNIEIQNFEPKKMDRAYVCMKISEYPPWGCMVNRQFSSRFRNGNCYCCLVYRPYPSRFHHTYLDCCMVYWPYSSRFRHAYCDFALSTSYIQTDFAMLTVILAWSTDHIQADFAMLAVIAAWYTGNIQTDFVILTVIAAWSTGNIRQISPCLMWLLRGIQTIYFTPQNNYNWRTSNFRTWV